MKQLEKIKTVVLVVLIVVSLLLSGILWNTMPHLDSLSSANYIAPQPFGRAYEAEELVQPAYARVHTGDGKHFQARADTNLYKKLVVNMKQWNVYSFTPMSWNKEDWESIAGKKRGIELIYSGDVLEDTLGELLTIRGQAISGILSASRIWLYSNKEDGTVQVLFISDSRQRIIRARISLTATELEAYFHPPLLASLTEQIVYRPFSEKTGNPAVYVPKDQLKMYRYRYFYQPITAQQMLSFLFTDAGLAREVTERDGTQIYTNGSQTVSIPKHHTYLVYRNPIQVPKEAEEENNFNDSLHAAVSFMNKHGGWPGTYQFAGVDTALPGKSRAAVYRFRQHVGSYPLYSEHDGETVVVIETAGDSVAQAQYPMRQLDTYFERTATLVMNGGEIARQLERKGIPKEQVIGIELAMYAGKRYDFMEVTPVWVIQQRNKPPLYLAAAVSGGRGEINGLE
ncbi:regulatory protein YycH of two-component signal transduction system YycFG [Aneurinibacillus soli]|uniref:Two-component system YycF/YycG regulatory protein YycH n=1 Tax=Aneurinibacillus soli TaxID=1500254 RepID=A0A0U5B5R2_9BACL|nr:two-component system activity regulator YycH [Aneurinibacillus soli]PYE61266.1 regulatory protein YycH of two-component signal transduction system YycFG [Aneurinibacillus soli]BAU26300.1 Two-component system YycF/YycG regulatory protein YycH [Aneurinibacillus soli]